MHLPGYQTVKGHSVTKTITVTWLPLAAVAVVLLMPTWDCTLYDCLGF